MISFKEFLTETKRVQSQIPFEIDSEIQPRKPKSIKESVETIVSAVQKDGGFIYVYGVSGLLCTIATSGKLIGFTPNNINVSENGFVYVYDANGAIINMIPESEVNEMTKDKVLTYINNTQDKDRYFKDIGRLDSRLNSFVLAQKKVGISKAKPKVMATDRKRHV